VSSIASTPTSEPNLAYAITSAFLVGNDRREYAPRDRPPADGPQPTMPPRRLSSDDRRHHEALGCTKTAGWLPSLRDMTRTLRRRSVLRWIAAAVSASDELDPRTTSSATASTTRSPMRVAAGRVRCRTCPMPYVAVRTLPTKTNSLHLLARTRYLYYAPDAGDAQARNTTTQSTDRGIVIVRRFIHSSSTFTNSHR
jgi:hypothetical protein